LPNGQLDLHPDELAARVVALVEVVGEDQAERVVGRLLDDGQDEASLLLVHATALRLVRGFRTSGIGFILNGDAGRRILIWRRNRPMPQVLAMIRFACPACNAVMTVPPNAAGKKGNCPKCGQRIRIPAPPAAKHTTLGRLLPEQGGGSTDRVARQPEGWHAPMSSPQPTFELPPPRRRLPALVVVTCVLLIVAGAAGAAFYFSRWRAAVVVGDGGGAVVVMHETPTGGPALTRPASKSELTEDEKIAWQKYRQRHTERTFQAAAYFPADDAFKTSYVNLDKMSGHWSSYLNADAFTGNFDALVGPAGAERDKEASGLKWAEAEARRHAAEPAIKATVVVDLFSQAAPFAVRWYFDDGSGVKESVAAPFPELEQKLKSYITYSQAIVSKP
jgi:hypothetical protein